jgi:HEAT repeat protein
MNRSKFLTVFLVLFLVAFCGFAVFKLTESKWIDTSLDGQTRSLQSGWAFQRRAAATGLAQFPGDVERVAPALLKAIGDPDREVRANAIQSLKAIGKLPDTAAPVLVDVLEHNQDSTTRQDAALLLGMTRVQSAAAALVEALDDHDPQVRLAAMNALSLHGVSVGTGPGVDKLIAVIASAQPENMRLAAIQALGATGRDQERVARFLTEILKTDPSATVRNDAVLLLRNTKFGFEIPALIAALDDESPQVRLSAGSGLGAIGLSDDRAVPALCRAARKADALTREGFGANIGKLRFDSPPDGSSVENATRRFQTAVRELGSVLDHTESAARMETVSVLVRVAASYQQSAHPALLDPAREALKSVLARIADENEELPIRLHAMNHWAFIQPKMTPPIGGRRATGDSPAPRDLLNARAAWLGALASSLKSPSEPIRSRAVEILVDSMKESVAEDWYREAWRKNVPILAESTASNDAKVRAGAVAILNMLGPEAVQALDSLKSLARDSKNSAEREAAERAVESISSVDRLKAKDPKARIAAAETLGRLGWRAAPAVPALAVAIADPDVEVRLAATNALRVLGSVSVSAVSDLATALPREPDAAVRVAALAALDAIAPASPPVLGAHLSALRDPDSAVRKAAATFQKVPLDDSLVTALGTALADSSDEVCQAVAGSLTAILFEKPAVVPILVKALRDDKQQKAVIGALDKDYERDPDSRGLSHFRVGVPELQAAVNVAIPVLRDALTVKNAEITARVFYLLGRISSFSAVTRNEDLRKAVEPALLSYLLGLEDSDPPVRQEVLARLDSIPIRRVEIVTALLKFLARSDQSPDDRKTAFAALAAQAAFSDSDANLRAILEPAVPILTQSLDAPEPEIRESAVLTLGYIGSGASPADEKLQNLAPRTILKPTSGKTRRGP